MLGRLRRFMGRGEARTDPDQSVQPPETQTTSKSSKVPKKVFVARLPTKYFTGSNKLVTEGETYGLIQLHIEEAELDSVQRGKGYFAVLSIGSQTLSTKRQYIPKKDSRRSSRRRLGRRRKGGEEAAAQLPPLPPSAASLAAAAAAADPCPPADPLSDYMASGECSYASSSGSLTAAVAAEGGEERESGGDTGDSDSGGRLDTGADGEADSVAAAAEAAAAEAAAPEEQGGIQGRLVWGAGSTFVLQKDAATVVQLSVYQAGRLDGALSNFLVGWASLDLASYFDQSTSGDNVIDTWLTLADPTDSALGRGRIKLSGEASTLGVLEQQMWRRLLTVADFDGDGLLSLEEFTVLLKSCGCELSEEEIEELFRAADADGSGELTADELAELLVTRHRAGEFCKLIKRCPIDGAELTPGDDYSNIIYIHLSMNEGTGPALKGGFSTQAQASRAWMLRMSEWATQPLAGTPSALFRGNRYTAGGLRQGASAAHILVFDRSSKRVEEERIDPVLVLAMRSMYQSRVGRLMMKAGLYGRLKTMTEAKGRYMDSPESVKEIEPFLRAFRGQVSLDELAQPITDFKCFNEFFYRKLKPEARPVASQDVPEVLVSAADCRLMVFHSVSDATRYWIKGRRFSLAGLLADTQPGFPLASAFTGGSLGVFRLAPQDYHRFHSPVDGTIRSIQDVPGQLYTVNPIAVNSRFANVLTENKRSVLILDSPVFGQVAYVAVGATLVGSICWTASEGQAVRKGEELGYFAFGGSTLVVVFQQGAVCWDEDLVQNSFKSLETKVRMGERLGVLKGSALEPAPEVKKARAADANTNTQGVVPLDERPDTQLMTAAGGREDSCADLLRLQQES